MFVISGVNIRIVKSLEIILFTGSWVIREVSKPGLEVCLHFKEQSFNCIVPVVFTDDFLYLFLSPYCVIYENFPTVIIN